MNADPARHAPGLFLSGFFRLTILKNGENGRKQEKTGGDRN